MSAILRLNEALAGRYSFDREIGEGGMATVYLADDLKHDRKVALKVLKPELAAIVGAERFLAEIKTTANLQHPHILPLFDSGEAGGFLFHVMPYVEGESLRERLDREHQLPIEDAVRIATDLAEALDYAHRHGVIHRDIKPGNVLLHDGQPVIADFGIALAVGAAGGHRLTETGLSLGTPHYMSPEQATGDQTVGPTTDIYALGCVLYEMLIGEPPYTGSTPQAILGKIIAGEPSSATAERKSVPAYVDAAIATALEKLPADRFPQASTFATALKDPGFRYGGGASAGDRPRSWSPGTLIFAALSVLLATSWAITSRSSGSFQQAELVQLPIGLPPGQGLVAQDQQGRPAAISPDGQSIAYVARSESGVMLHLRPPGQLDGTPLPGTAGARLPFFSPDGLSIGFFADNTIKRIPAAGGSVDTVATLGASELHGATWADTDTIYFTRSGGKQNLWKVAAAGGSPAQVTHANVDHSWPFALPGGQHILYNHNAGGDDSVGISLLSLETGETQMLLPGGRGPAYSPSGHLVYSRRDGSLYARRFDVARLVVSGDEIRLLGGVRRGQASGYFTVSDEGTLLYVTAPGPVERSVVAVSRTGEESPIKGVDCAPCGDPAYSPDGRMLAVARSDPQDDNIWVFSLEDGSAYPVGGGGPGHIQPEWRPPAGDQISYNADQGGRVYLVPNDGRAAPDTLVLSERRQNVGSWAPDGRSFVLPLQVFESLEARLFRIDVDRDRTPEQLTSGSVDLAPRVSPDGAWIAYQSRQTGRDEVWVRAFDGVGAEVKVSSGGGRAPVWATDMSELYYRVGSAVWSASVQTQPTFSIVRRTPLFDGPFASSVIAADYDVHPTGGEFAMTKLGVWSARMVLVRNLSVELQRRLPN